MLVIISPTKMMNTGAGLAASMGLPTSVPRFLPQTQLVVDHMRKLSKTQLASTLKISATLAELNLKRFKDWDAGMPAAVADATVFSYVGPAFSALDAASMSAEEITEGLNPRLRVISAAYGLLRPLDRIAAYRLPFATPSVKLCRQAEKEPLGLYQFWGDTLRDQLIEDLGDSKLIVDVASKEYSKALGPLSYFRERGITVCCAKFLTGGKSSSTVYSKQGRGLLARYIAQQDCKVNDVFFTCGSAKQTLDDVKKFDLQGYAYDEDASDGKELIVFARDSAPEKKRKKSSKKK